MPNVITYNLAPIPRWFFTDLTGKPLSAGSLFTYEDLDRAVYKPVYQDIAGQNPWPEPVPFELNGMPKGALYWSSDSDYYLAIFDQFDVPQFTVEHYNAPFANQINPAPTFVTNYVRNAQFTWWLNTGNFSNTAYSQDNNDFYAADWLFFRNNTNATINISQQFFDLGQADVPFNPVSYFHYECTNTGGGAETLKCWQQNYESVQTFSGKTVTLNFWARSITNSVLNASILQNFGTGGSPSAPVITSAANFNLSSVWREFTATITVPTILGKSEGTNLDDFTALQFNLPLNALATIDLCNVLLQQGAQASSFPYLTVDQQAKELDAVSAGIPSAGDFLMTVNPVAPAGWVLANDGTIGNPASGATIAKIATKALYAVIWNAISNNYAPLFNSDGTPAGISLTYTTNFATNSQLTVSSTTNLQTGTAVTVSSNGTLSSPLVSNTSYYTILVDATHITLATSFANAQQGIFITLTGDGSGTQTLTSQRGATAEEDYNANRRLALTKTVGRVLATQGQASLTETFTAYNNSVNFAAVDTGTDIITLTAPASFINSTPIQLATTGTLASPLVAATTYYVIVIDSTHIKLATSASNAFNNIPIDLTTTGSGVQSIYDSNLVIADSSSFYTGTPVTLTTTGSLPPPLAISTTYYVINIDATHIELATNLINALLGVAIPLTGAGSPTNTVAISYVNWQPGQFIGESFHALIGNENGPHTHGIPVSNGAGAQDELTGMPDQVQAIVQTFSSGGGAPHNNMPPTTFVYCKLKL